MGISKLRKKPVEQPVSPGSTLAMGRYEVERRLGQGGFGVVLLARDVQLDRRVALKMPKVHGETDPSVLERFYREARAAAMLQHPNICPVHDIGEMDGNPFISMSFIDGKPLSALIDRDKPIAERAAAVIIRKLALALNEAHQRGIIHRDIKPANVMIDHRNEPILMDFGLALNFAGDDPRLTAEGDIYGSPAYMSPEQVRAKELTPATDIYSLGVVLYELLTGRTPFWGGSIQIANQIVTRPAPPPEGIRKNLSPALSEICLRMMAKAPRDRFSGMREVASALGKFLKGSWPDPPKTRGSAPTSVVEPQTPWSDLDEEGRAIPREALPRRSGKKRRRRKRKPSRLRVWLGVGGAAVFALCCWAILGGGAAVRPGTANTSPDVHQPTPPRQEPPPAAITAGKKLKVFVLAGQSNMGGPAPVLGLDELTRDPVKARLVGHLKRPDGSWVVRDDVWVKSKNKVGRLTVGFGEREGEFGPELAFGHVVGNALDEPVLLIKYCRGPMSLANGCRPPSSGGETGEEYDNMVREVRDVLGNLRSYVPSYRGQGYELAGFVWFQAWNDFVKEERVAEYEKNQANLIRDLREAWDAPGMPVVIGEFGAQGTKFRDTPPEGKPRALALREAQKAVADSAEFRETVRFVRTAPYSKPTAEGGPGFLYHRNPEAFYCIGDAFGRAMLELIGGE